MMLQQLYCNPVIMHYLVQAALRYSQLYIGTLMVQPPSESRTSNSSFIAVLAASSGCKRTSTLITGFDF